jgi:hypothetical protein
VVQMENHFLDFNRGGQNSNRVVNWENYFKWGEPPCLKGLWRTLNDIFKEYSPFRTCCHCVQLFSFVIPSQCIFCFRNVQKKYFSWSMEMSIKVAALFDLISYTLEVSPVKPSWFTIEFYRDKGDTGIRSDGTLSTVVFHCQHSQQIGFQNFFWYKKYPEAHLETFHKMLV